MKDLDAGESAFDEHLPNFEQLVGFVAYQRSRSLTESNTYQQLPAAWYVFDAMSPCVARGGRNPPMCVWSKEYEHNLDVVCA